MVDHFLIYLSCFTKLHDKDIASLSRGGFHGESMFIYLFISRILVLGQHGRLCEPMWQVVNGLANGCSKGLVRGDA